ncbi:DUF6376 family protein [Paenibacillus agricola]|uniref:Lipoprotein n=1 Tax=Paenibacillus agricola TaxID=2716264 RepID=A0ABX0JGC5_9BACL|nr:DUF6376 family protein [Paenibacillus agricola]NHN34435.1 hypothetical protein [Paenibacillus agricola]
MRIRLLFMALAIFLLPGCSLLTSVNQSLNYVEEATTYINNATQFAQNIPVLAQQAVTDSAARASLLKELETMKTKITAFNAMEAPAFAQEIHKQLVVNNEKVIAEINGYLPKINTDTFDFTSLANSPMIQTIQEIMQALNQIQKLTP